MDTYGIIGNPLGHSFSKAYFTEKFEREHLNAEFLNFPIPQINDLEKVLASQPNLKGICVTIPYKEAVIPFLDEIDQQAQEIGAINSIRIRWEAETPKLKGFNTDIYGFTESLKQFLENTKPKALILGTGGASKAIAKGLERMGIPYRFVSRTASDIDYLTYEDLNREIMETHQLIVNCSPLGTFPNVDDCPNIPYQFIGPEHFLYDLVYNPNETLFMKKGAERGAHTHNGLKMLHLQAEKSWMIWNEEN